MFGIGNYISAIDKITGSTRTKEISSWKRREKADKNRIDKMFKKYKSKMKNRGG